ncbi:ABC transporter permease subunit [Mycoplasmatota bacterium]|nr:ABC transporter permease subunit [Mycoplasmatota bacterium]
MKKLNWYYGLAIVILTVVYVILSEKVDNEMILPKLGLIFNYFKNLDFTVFVTHTGATVLKVVISYLLSLTLALLLAIIAYYRKFFRMINPYISILKTLPTISIILIALIWLGNEKSIYLIANLVILPILYETFFYHLKNIDPKLVDVSKIYQFNFRKKLRFLYYYPLLEGLMVSLKQTFGLCFKVIVMAEVIGQSQSGIGAQIQNEKVNLEMVGVFSWTIILIIFVLMIDFALDYIAKKIIRWKCYNEN